MSQENNDCLKSIYSAVKNWTVINYFCKLVINSDIVIKNYNASSNCIDIVSKKSIEYS